MEKKVLALIFALAISLIPINSFAEFKPSTGEINGYMVNEYFCVINHHDRDIEGRHGFWFRRIYFTYNNQLSDTVEMRLRLEMNSAPDFYTFAVLTPYVKDAYIDFKIAGQHLIAGIQSPPSFAKIEDIWGYRSLEKTPLDLHRWTSSRDFGVSLKGGKTFPYQVMFANGSSNKSETNKGKKLFGALGYEKNGFFIEAMGQYEKTRNEAEEYILQGFASYRGEWGRLGLQFAHWNSKPKNTEESFNYNVISAFAVISAGKNLELIGRIDKYFGDGYKTNYSGSEIDYIPFAENAESNFIIGAVSYQVLKNVWLIPNIKLVFYNQPDEGDKPTNNVYANLTLWFKF